MPRVAVGDLTLDVDVPERFERSYSLNGSLLLEDPERGAKFEVSGIAMTPNDPAEQQLGPREVLERAAHAGKEPHRAEAHFAMFREANKTWFAGFGNHLIIATRVKGEPGELDEILESVAPAYDPFPPPGERVALSSLRPSHAIWFAQRRKSMFDALGWAATQPLAAERLDDFWEELVARPPADQHQLNTMISCATVGFGDLLGPLGFEWGVVSDAWGISVGTVALRGTANVVIVPDSFVAKRWERQEPRFFVEALEAISGHVEQLRGGAS